MPQNTLKNWEIGESKWVADNSGPMALEIDIMTLIALSSNSLVKAFNNKYTTVELSVMNSFKTIYGEKITIWLE